jgi:N utilization substance protein B
MRTATPVSVVLDEAIQLAKRFGSESSPSFVNGVLDAVARELRGYAAVQGRRESNGGVA